MSRVTVLAGEGEYSSARTMRLVADDLEQKLGLQVDYRSPDPLEDVPDLPESSFGDLSPLQDADLLVVYTRFRRLPDLEMQQLSAYLDTGRPVIALRTSTHAFSFPESSPWFAWNDGFGADVLGSPWVSHHGHTSTTRVDRLPGEDHPVLENLPDSFHSPSWLYRVTLAPDCRPLLYGTPLTPESEPTPGPVAWVRDGARRVFFTSLGHDDDFALEPFRRLLLNAARWCLSSPTSTPSPARAAGDLDQKAVRS